MTDLAELVLRELTRRALWERRLCHIFRQRQKKKPLVMRSCNAEYTRLASKLPRGDYGCGHTLPKNLEELKLMDFKEDLKCGFYR